METKTLIGFAVTAKLICVFVFAYAKCWLSHDAKKVVSIKRFHNSTLLLGQDSGTSFLDRWSLWTCGLLSKVVHMDLWSPNTGGSYGHLVS